MQRISSGQNTGDPEFAVDGQLANDRPFVGQNFGNTRSAVVVLNTCVIKTKCLDHFGKIRVRVSVIRVGGFVTALKVWILKFMNGGVTTVVEQEDFDGEVIRLDGLQILDVHLKPAITNDADNLTIRIASLGANGSGH